MVKLNSIVQGIRRNLLRLLPHSPLRHLHRALPYQNLMAKKVSMEVDGNDICPKNVS